MGGLIGAAAVGVGGGHLPHGPGPGGGGAAGGGGTVVPSVILPPGGGPGAPTGGPGVPPQRQGLAGPPGTVSKQTCLGKAGQSVFLHANAFVHDPRIHCFAYAFRA